MGAKEMTTKRRHFPLLARRPRPLRRPERENPSSAALFEEDPDERNRTERKTLQSRVDRIRSEREGRSPPGEPGRSRVAAARDAGCRPRARREVVGGRRTCWWVAMGAGGEAESREEGRGGGREDGRGGWCSWISESGSGRDGTGRGREAENERGEA